MRIIGVISGVKKYGSRMKPAVDNKQSLNVCLVVDIYA